jgi:hypothetical protein
VKACPRCGHPGGLIACPMCHENYEPLTIKPSERIYASQTEEDFAVYVGKGAEGRRQAHQVPRVPPPRV